MKRKENRCTEYHCWQRLKEILTKEQAIISLNLRALEKIEKTCTYLNKKGYYNGYGPRSVEELKQC